MVDLVSVKCDWVEYYVMYENGCYITERLLNLNRINSFLLKENRFRLLGESG